MDYQKIVRDTLCEFIENAKKALNLSRELKSLPENAPHRSALSNKYLFYVQNCYRYAPVGELEKLYGSAEKTAALALLTEVGVTAYLNRCRKNESYLPFSFLIPDDINREILAHDVFISILDGIYDPKITERVREYIVNERQANKKDSAGGKIRKRYLEI